MPKRTTRNIVIAVVAGVFVLALGAGAFILSSVTVMDGSLRGRDSERMQELEARMEAAREQKQVLFVVRDIQKGTAIQMVDLETRSVPAGKVVSGALTEPEQAVGRHAKVNIAQGENLIEDQLESPKTPPAKKNAKD
jgi:Flp pilus assembly protein CpaB